MRRKLKKGFQKRLTSWCLFVLVVGLIGICSCIYLDNNVQSKEAFYSLLNEWQENTECGGVFVPVLKQIRNIGRATIHDYGSMVINYTAILESAVIFFYGVSDNKHFGIPHRTIIAYSIGSLTIPILFIVSLGLSLFVYFIEYTQYNLTFAMGVLYVLFLQVLVIVEILWSTSFWRAINVVKHVERKQYKTLMGLDIVPYTHLDMVRHLEQAFLSDEMITDKVRLARELLEMPLVRIKFWKPLIWVEEDIFLYEIEHMYNFYYNNIITVLHHFDGREGKDTRNVIYLMLYEFINKMEEHWRKCDKWMTWNNMLELDLTFLEVYRNRLATTHAMAVSGVMNAVQFSGVKEADSFCNYVLRDCISDAKKKKMQCNLYIIFQEMRYAINSGTKTCLSEMTCLKEWELITKKEMGELGFYWNVWGKQYSLVEWKKGEHFWRAIQTMCGYGNLSRQISYIVVKIEQMKKKDFGNNASESFSANQQFL